MVGSGPDPVPGPTGAGQAIVDTRSDVISVVAEHLRIKKRTVEGEGVRVRVVTDEEEAPANVTLRSKRIEVERVPVGRVVESAPPVREEDDVTIIPVMEEVVVTETRLVLKEELHVRRVAETREHQQTVLLRRQRAEVERLPATGKPIAEATTPTSIKEDQR
jgi:stress response protein YsnF